MSEIFKYIHVYKKKFCKKNNLAQLEYKYEKKTNI